MSQILAPMIGAMVICRSIACFIGYPYKEDPTFTDVDLLLKFSGTLDACAQANTLWNFSPIDVATIFSPLIDYAELATKGGKKPQEDGNTSLSEMETADIEKMQSLLNFADAHFFVMEIDNLARVQNSWSKWFGFIRYTKTLQMEGLPKHLAGALPIDAEWDLNIGKWEIPYLMRKPMAQEIAAEIFFESCLSMRSYIIGYNAFTQSFLSLIGRESEAPRKAVQKPKPPPGLVLETPHKPKDTIEVENPWEIANENTPTSSPASNAGADPFLSPSWTIASELRGRTVQVSPRMAHLMDGTTVEPRNTNWYNKGRFEYAVMK